MGNNDVICACAGKKNAGKSPAYFTSLLSVIPLAFLYFFLDRIADWTTYQLIGLDKGTRFAESIRFFIFDFPKVLILLVVIVFGVGIVRSFFTPERTRGALEGKPLFIGNIMASLLGIVTPFCSCSDSSDGKPLSCTRQPAFSSR